MKENKLTVIDFFCGAGGFSEGFREMGFEILKGYDHWKPAIDTFNHNFGTNSKVKNILDFTIAFVSNKKLNKGVKSYAENYKIQFQKYQYTTRWYIHFIIWTSIIILLIKFKNQLAL